MARAERCAHIKKNTCKIYKRAYKKILRPPLIIPTVGHGREEKVQATIDAYRTAAKQAAAWESKVLIITSPRQILYADYFHISPSQGAAGGISAFGAAQTRLWNT